MRKALIYLSAFCVSFLTIYSVYYYSKVYSIQRGLVVSADELKNTVIGPGLAAHVESGNAIYIPGLLQTLQYKGDTTNKTLWGSAAGNGIPDSSFLGAEGKYSKAFTEDLTNQVGNKYKNHPPIDFPNTKEGDSVLFSYFFEKLDYPKGFVWPQKPLHFANSSVRGLMYAAPDKSAVKVRFYKNASGQMAIVVPLRNGQEAVYYCGGRTASLASQFNEAESYLKSASEYALKKDEGVVLPDIDFYIEKKYSLQEISQNELPIGNRPVVEDRMKIKTFAYEKEPVDFQGTTFDFSSPTLFYLRKGQDTLPYFAMLIRDPEVLIRKDR